MALTRQVASSGDTRADEATVWHSAKSALGTGVRGVHRHRLRTIRCYDYEDAATLHEDFWREVDQVLKERGSIP